jgi:hypothetical protein
MLHPQQQRSGVKQAAMQHAHQGAQHCHPARSQVSKSERLEA